MLLGGGVERGSCRGCNGAGGRRAAGRAAGQRRHHHRHRRAGEAVAEGHRGERCGIHQARHRPAGRARPDTEPAGDGAQRARADKPRRADDPRAKQRRSAPGTTRFSRRGAAADGASDRRTHSHLQRAGQQHRRAVGRRPCRGVPDAADHHAGGEFDRRRDLHPHRRTDVRFRGPRAADRRRVPAAPSLGRGVRADHRRSGRVPRRRRLLPLAHVDDHARAGGRDR